MTTAAAAASSFPRAIARATARPTASAVAPSLVPARGPARPRRAPSPFIKWVGGKGRLLSQLLPLLPPGAELMRHVEPFAGGAAMFFSRRPQQALLCDLNANLIHTYTVVRDRVEELMGALDQLAVAHCKEAYYQVRERYNRPRALGPVEKAATFIYLNKTCFNGLHRVNRKGEFNVPFGRYKNPRILDAEGLYAASAQLQHTELLNAPFEALLKHARPGDMVYLDPPYEPVSRTASFTRYGKDGFEQQDQRRLRDVFSELDRRGCKLMLSNSDVPFIRDLYKDYRIDVVAAPRAINCNSKRRGPVSEVVVRNY